MHFSKEMEKNLSNKEDPLEAMISNWERQSIEQFSNGIKRDELKKQSDLDYDEIDQIILKRKYQNETTEQRDYYEPRYDFATLQPLGLPPGLELGIIDSSQNSVAPITNGLSHNQDIDLIEALKSDFLQEEDKNNPYQNLPSKKEREERRRLEEERKLSEQKKKLEKKTFSEDKRNGSTKITETNQKSHQYTSNENDSHIKKGADHVQRNPENIIKNDMPQNANDDRWITNEPVNKKENKRSDAEQPRINPFAKEVVDLTKLKQNKFIALQSQTQTIMNETVNENDYREDLNHDSRNSTIKKDIVFIETDAIRDIQDVSNNKNLGIKAEVNKKPIDNYLEENKEDRNGQKDSDKSPDSEAEKREENANPQERRNKKKKKRKGNDQSNQPNNVQAIANEVGTGFNPIIIIDTVTTKIQPKKNPRPKPQFAHQTIFDTSEESDDEPKKKKKKKRKNKNPNKLGQKGNQDSSESESEEEIISAKITNHRQLEFQIAPAPEPLILVEQEEIKSQDLQPALQEKNEETKINKIVQLEEPKEKVTEQIKPEENKLENLEERLLEKVIEVANKIHEDKDDLEKHIDVSVTQVSSDPKVKQEVKGRQAVKVDPRKKMIDEFNLNFSENEDDDD